MLKLICRNLFVFTQLFASFAHAETCVQSETRETEFAKKITKPASFCVDDELELFAAEACVKKNCLAETQVEKNLPIEFKELGGAFGTPASKLCQKTGGSFEILEFKVSSKWISSDRCVYADGSFVSGSILLKENRERLAKFRSSP